MIRTSLALALGGALFLTACADPATSQKIADMEIKMAELEKRVEAVEKGGGGGANDGANPNIEDPLRAAYQAQGNGDFDTAKAELAKAVEAGCMDNARYRDPCSSIKTELDVIGKDAPATFEVEKWYQGETSLTEGKATLLVFWEVWCPHCKREVPELVKTYDKYKGDGLNVVGLTRLTRGKTEQEVLDFMKETSVTYPIAKEDGQLADYFAVSGIPAAAVVKDGKVVWRGHPAKLDDAKIQSFLN